MVWKQKLKRVAAFFLLGEKCGGATSQLKNGTVSITLILLEIVFSFFFLFKYHLYLPFCAVRVCVCVNCVSRCVCVCEFCVCVCVNSVSRWNLALLEFVLQAVSQVSPMGRWLSPQLCWLYSVVRLPAACQPQPQCL